jgi:hypothetical protein
MVAADGEQNGGCEYGRRVERESKRERIKWRRLSTACPHAKIRLTSPRGSAAINGHRRRGATPG